MSPRELVVILVFCSGGTFATLVNAEAGKMQYQTIQDMLKDTSAGDAVVGIGDILEADGWEYKVVEPADGGAHLTTEGGLSLRALPDGAGRIFSSQLGWSAGGNIHDALSSFVSAATGDTHLVIDERYTISGSRIDLPDGFTLEGTEDSSISLANVGGSSGVQFSFGSNSEITNMEFIAEGPNDIHQNVRLLEARDATNFEISNSSFEGNIGIFVDLHDVSNFHCENVVFDGGLYQMRWAGKVDNPTVDSSAFVNSAGDGIKTITGQGTGTTDALITNSLFYNNGRDGIDTTGGFKDSTISNSVFMDNKVSAIDLKTIINDPTDFDTNLMNTGIIIENSEFVDNQNGIVFTTIDRLAAAGYESMTSAEASKWAVQDIEIRDSTFEYTGDGRKNAFLIKDAHSISWDGITLLGAMREVAEKPNYDWQMPYNIDSNDVSTGDIRTQAYRDGLLQIGVLDGTPAVGTETSEDPASVDGVPKPQGLAQDDDVSGADVGTPDADAALDERTPTSSDNDDDGASIRGETEDAVQDVVDNETSGQPQTTGTSDVPIDFAAAEYDAWLDGYTDDLHKIGGDGDDRLSFFSSDIGLRLTGGHGRDLLVGGKGGDVLEGGNDSDTLRGHGGNDTLLGGEGRDFLYGYQGIDFLFGQEGDDRLEGRLGDDHLFGGAGDDIVKGDRGADHLNGGLGSDRLWGGDGDDIFQFDVLDAADYDDIMDFRGDDRIGLEASVFSDLGSGVEADEIEYGAEATTETTRLLFDSETRHLSYDPDGSGEQEAIVLAHLHGVREIDASSFAIYNATSQSGSIELADVVPITGQLAEGYPPVPDDDEYPDDFALAG